MRRRSFCEGSIVFVQGTFGADAIAAESSPVSTALNLQTRGQIDGVMGNLQSLRGDTRGFYHQHGNTEWGEWGCDIRRD